jgi:hypothetical protein
MPDETTVEATTATDGEELPVETLDEVAGGSSEMTVKPEILKI